MEFARYERAITLAKRIAEHFNATPEIIYISNNGGRTRTIIEFFAKNFPDFSVALNDAIEIDSHRKEPLNKNGWILKICPDDGDLAMVKLNITKDQAIKEFISNDLGLPVNDRILSSSKWEKWDNKTDDEVFAEVSSNIEQIMDIFRISTQTAKKVRKEIELQFESFNAWKSETKKNN